MRNFVYIFQRLQNLSSIPFLKLAHLRSSICYLLVCYYRCSPLKFYSLFIQLFYFLSISSLGFLVLLAFKPRTAADHNNSFRPRNLDLFFTSVSATTVSSMSTVEMEVFSNSQLIILTILMFIGGEVFTSMFELFIKQFNLKKSQHKVASVNSDLSSPNPTNPRTNSLEEIELSIVEIVPQKDKIHESFDLGYLKYSSIKYLAFVVLGYLLVVHIFGVTLVSLYLIIVSSTAREVLKKKDLKLFTFSIFTTVSTFASCGFIPTNENMMIFNKNSGLLLILIPQVLVGNTLFPSFLRFSISILAKLGVKRDESDYLLTKSGEIKYLHSLPGQHSLLLVPTVFAFILVQFILFCSMEWSSEALSGLNSYQKIIGALFQCVNTRHTGETIVDLSIISPAILVLFVVMMYLPPYTSFLPIKEGEDHVHDPEKAPIIKRSSTKKMGNKFMDNYIFSQLSYLAIFIILVCITERRKIKEDPLNFSVLNIAIEVISAYGNVGFTTGYSCKRQINPSAHCRDKWYGFVGRWSDEGKIILIVVMFFGRLKKFNMNGGKSWKLL